MTTQIESPEIDEAKDAARRAVDRLIELTLVQDSSRGRAAADALCLLRYRVTEAVMDAFPRAESPSQREHLIHVLDYVTYHWHYEARDFLEQVARDEPDASVRRRAKDAWRYLARPDEFDGDPD
jgi:hypothetical protein